MNFFLAVGPAPIGTPPTPPSVTTDISGGPSLLWPLLMMLLFGFIAYQVFMYWRRSHVRLAKDWEDKFWIDFYEWRGEPTNRV